MATINSVNQGGIVQTPATTEVKQPQTKSYLLNQEIKDSVSFGNTQAAEPEEKSGGVLKWVLGLAALGAGAYFLRGHFKGKGAKATAGALTDAAKPGEKAAEAATNAAKPGEKAAEAVTKAEQTVAGNAAKPATSEVKAHDFTMHVDDPKEVPAKDFTMHMDDPKEVPAKDFTMHMDDPKEVPAVLK